MAEGNLFIAIARFVYCFDVAQDPSQPVVVDKQFPASVEAEPYKVIITPRSEAHRRLVEKECRSAVINS